MKKGYSLSIIFSMTIIIGLYILQLFITTQLLISKRNIQDSKGLIKSDREQISKGYVEIDEMRHGNQMKTILRTSNIYYKNYNGIIKSKLPLMGVEKVKRSTLISKEKVSYNKLESQLYELEQTYEYQKNRYKEGTIRKVDFEYMTYQTFLRLSIINSLLDTNGYGKPIQQTQNEKPFSEIFKRK
ncbi:MAG: hypothetical protein M9887_01090 [Chitinophagales bacterium]|nr:hypothetical protein [Chitinophagales bacterium]